MYSDFPERMCIYQSLSLSFSLYLNLQKRFGSRSDPMEFRKECFVNLKICAWCDRKYAKCRTKADAQDKMFFQYISISVYIVRSHARIQRGDRGFGPPPPPTPWKITKIWIFLAILNRIPWNSQNYQASIQRWAIIGTPAKRHLNSGRWWSAFSDIWILSPLKKKGKKRCQSSDPDQIRMEFRK